MTKKCTKMPKIVTNSVNYSKNDKNRDDSGLINTFFRTQQKGCPSPDSLLKQTQLTDQNGLAVPQSGQNLEVIPALPQLGQFQGASAAGAAGAGATGVASGAGAA